MLSSRSIKYLLVLMQVHMSFREYFSVSLGSTLASVVLCSFTPLPRGSIMKKKATEETSATSRMPMPTCSLIATVQSIPAPMVAMELMIVLVCKMELRSSVLSVSVTIMDCMGTSTNV